MGAFSCSIADCLYGGYIPRGPVLACKDAGQAKLIMAGLIASPGTSASPTSRSSSPDSASYAEEALLAQGCPRVLKSKDGQIRPGKETDKEGGDFGG